MADPFVGEIRIVTFDFPPRGWALCNGQLLQVNQNQSLFSVLRTIYGGDGVTTFALPDFRGRVPMHTSGAPPVGQKGGEEAHRLTADEMPRHAHTVHALSAPGTTNVPQGAFLAGSNVAPYRTDADTTFAPALVSSVGGSQLHENRQPFLTLAFIIALDGIFPSRN